MYLCLYVSVALSLNHCLGVQVSVHVIPDCYYHDTVSLIVVGDVAAAAAVVCVYCPPEGRRGR